MKVIDRLTGKEVILFNREKWLSLGWSKEQADKKERSIIISTFYTPYYYNYLDFSPFMNRVLKKYKDAPLLPYIPTDYERECIKKDPSYIDLIPRFYVPGYDRAIGSDRVDTRLKVEFYSGWKNEEDFVLKFVNSTNPQYRIVKSTLKSK